MPQNSKNILILDVVNHLSARMVGRAHPGFYSLEQDFRKVFFHPWNGVTANNQKSQRTWSHSSKKITKLDQEN